MNSPKHVAIIMDGNGRWGIKKKNQEIMDIKRCKSCRKYYSEALFFKKNKIFNFIYFFNRKLEKT